MATTTPKNFGLNQVWSLPWRVSLDDYTHSGSILELVWVFTSYLLYSLHSSLYMLMSKSSLQLCFRYAQSLCFVCACGIRYESIYCTHTWNHIHYCTNIISINEWSIMSLVLVTYTIDQFCWTCVSRWFGHLIIKSCECVSVWSLVHLSIVHTLSHFLLKVLMTGLPSNIQTINPSSTRSIVN